MTGSADHLLQKLKQRGAEPLTREEIATIVAGAVQGMQGDLTPGDLRLYAELEALAAYIQNAKKEIANVQVDAINSTHIPTATDELDAVVGATADATNSIMNACDEIGAVAGTVGGEAGDQLNTIVTKIYEACNFQDITGQRITKVVKTLKHIEQQVMRLIEVFGAYNAAAGAAGRGAGAASQAAGSTISSSDEQGLLNGPQLPANAINQDEIDKLLADFDKPQS